VKLKNPCNFIAYFKIKIIVIKIIRTKYEEKRNWSGYSKIWQGQRKIQGEEKEEKKKKIVFSSKPLFSSPTSSTCYII